MGMLSQADANGQNFGAQHEVGELSRIISVMNIAKKSVFLFIVQSETKQGNYKPNLS